ncbi:hypothetical protein U7230_04675 [Carboxydochorda subterranea]|uniref:Uncharacterized protein n=1 Tax=Carboxydichorda subterranea TaxID=3109565 RepID=A0ABZ1C0M8_9FIRM|nr:hypothetical protein [Limnochorda sp. L945t]WRP18306.1 hypothetical protein U7230_04675 [Limnochorda sp. L945t]
MRRFVRGMLWGGVLGALLVLYATGSSGDRSQRADGIPLRRLRRQAAGEAAEAALKESRSSRLQLALDAGRAAVDATLALLGLKA